MFSIGFRDRLGDGSRRRRGLSSRLQGMSAYLGTKGGVYSA